MVQIKFFTDNGSEKKKTVDTVEKAILKYRKARKSRKGANFGHYSVDGGKTWFRI